MAIVDQPLAGRQREIYNSVFPIGFLRPPRNCKQFEVDVQYNAERVHEILIRDSCAALGIGNHEYVYGSTQKSGSDASKFCSFYPNSAPVENLTLPSAKDKTALLKNFGKLETWGLLAHWSKALGGSRLKKIFAAVADKLITTFIEWSYSKNYGSGVLDHLTFWTQQILLPYITHFLETLDPSEISKVVTEAELQRWREKVLTRLAALRVDELFEIIIEWDESAPGIEDLKHYTTNPATRSYVTSCFANVIQTRLLHPGASTIEILQVYISIIRAFRKLDPKGVLLERVARRLRRYLREREDTIKVVVTGLLSDFELHEDQQTIVANPDVLVELAYELQQRESDAEKTNHGELDWNNMEWVPDPIDAAPDYVRSMNTDVIGSVISLFESKDVFVRELQTTLAERLLRNKHDFDQEISVIEHLKIRFGDTALQGCEVMLRDVLDSRKLDQVIRQDQGFDLALSPQKHHTNDNNDMEDDGTDQTSQSLHAKILSRLFWPSLPEQPFKPPVPILEQRNRYEKGFESLKQIRKLTWIDSLGHVEVELTLEDRTFRDEVLPYQATVIYAFQQESDDADSISSVTIQRTVADLAGELDMAPALVRSACLFWASKRILTQVPLQPDMFVVLERLPVGEDLGAITNNTVSESLPPGQAQSANANANVNAAASAAAHAAAIEASNAIKQAEEAERKQKLQMYHQFVLSMLTNQGAMPLPRIAMMLGIVVPGGFPFSNEELKEFLGGMVKEGTLEFGAGGSYKVAN